ncbi:integrase arm-type DNA-binding domain-containing protein [Lonsdalea quercina]|uniref:integrase arm-type DNA-binding domain-containing protein n=1 Tax=Lonsdalea quercina TaxID=71657 RepID=UPI0039767A16
MPVIYRDTPFTAERLVIRLVIPPHITIRAHNYPSDKYRDQSAKPAEKEYTLQDGDGLSLLVKPSGSKIWRFNYYPPDTKKRASISFGSFPAVSLAEARQQREAAKANHAP